MYKPRHPNIQTPMPNQMTPTKWKESIQIEVGLTIVSHRTRSE
jgi:hypothetical protein